jgi:uncharacterized protein YacL
MDQERKTMKKIVALLSSIFMFVVTWFISSLLIALVWSYSRTEITIGSLTTNIAGLIGLIIAGLVATHTFRASLNAKTGKLYKKKR